MTMYQPQVKFKCKSLNTFTLISVFLRVPPGLTSFFFFAPLMTTAPSKGLATPQTGTVKFTCMCFWKLGDLARKASLVNLRSW